MHLIAYQGPKDKGTICHGTALTQMRVPRKFGHKKARYRERAFIFSKLGVSLRFTAHNFSEDKGQD